MWRSTMPPRNNNKKSQTKQQEASDAVGWKCLEAIAIIKRNRASLSDRALF